MSSSSRALLDLEANGSSDSSLGSRLRVCNNNDILLSQTGKPSDPPGDKPAISSVPKSQVLGKIKDFLGVILEANKTLQLESQDNSKDYDIEVLNGNESEYIEMDLMLGVADLHTPQAVAAAESAIAGYQPVIPLAGSLSDTESEENNEDSDTDNDDDNHNNEDHNRSSWQSPMKLESSKPSGDESSVKESETHKPKKRPKIVEL